MKKYVAFLMVTTLTLGTLVGCGKKAEEPVVVQAPAPVEETKTTPINREGDDGRVQIGADLANMAKPSDNEAPKGTSKTDYTVEDIATAIDVSKGVEMSYDENGSGFTIGVKESPDTHFMYMLINRTFDTGEVNKSGFYLLDKDAYIFIGDGEDNHFIEHKIENLSDAESKDLRSDTANMDSFIYDEDAIEDLKFVENKDYEGGNYDIVHFKSISDKEQYEEYDKLYQEALEKDKNATDDED